ncbi:MAG TPA: hypothetical protein VLR27_14620, partial [Acidimicrobiales bacterium]|nr:hypothetical protein [Acidimicrobiales bacterium]
MAQRFDELLGEHPGVATGPHRGVHGHEGAACVTAAQGVDEVVDGAVGDRDAAGGGHLVEGGQRVAGRAPTGLDDVVDHVVVELEPGVGDHVPDVTGEHVGGQQVELEVLGAGPDGGQHLLRLGGGQHEHDVLGRLLQRLQQRVGRCRREHVHLVEHVHLAVAARAHGDPAEQVAHGVHAVVGGGVELLEPVDVAPLLHRLAVGAGGVGLAVDGVLAVEDLGQDAGRRRLAGAA